MYIKSSGRYESLRVSEVPNQKFNSIRLIDFDKKKLQNSQNKLNQSKNDFLFDSNINNMLSNVL
jgi:hypothetical protein